MATTYPVDLQDRDGIVRESRIANFTDPNNAPAAGGTGTATAAAFKATGLTGSVVPSRYVGATADVAPTTGAHLVGDFVVSATGRMWVCTAAATPGTWVEVSSVTYAPLASPTLTGTVTVPAAAAANSAPRISQLSSYLTVTAGGLPQLAAAWVSGTPKQNPVARQVVVVLEITTDGTANVATCQVDVSADNATYTTVATPGASAAVNTVGAVTLMADVILPATWWLKLTLAHCSVSQSFYY